MTAPLSTVSNGRGKRGRFTKGNPGGPGRPRGPDFRRLIFEQAERRGVDVEDAVWDVFSALLERAKNGDVQAAKLILDRLCDSDPVVVDVTHQPMSMSERAARIEAILAAAGRRRQLAQDADSE